VSRGGDVYEMMIGKAGVNEYREVVVLSLIFERRVSI